MQTEIDHKIRKTNNVFRERVYFSSMHTFELIYWLLVRSRRCTGRHTQQIYGILVNRLNCILNDTGGPTCDQPRKISLENVYPIFQLVGISFIIFLGMIREGVWEGGNKGGSKYISPRIILFFKDTNKNLNTEDYIFLVLFLVNFNS